MGIIFYGVKQATIGLDEIMINCPSCEADNWADFMITSNYYHIYFIPIFPFEKEANIICQKCGLKQYNVPFQSKLITNIFGIKNKFKHPWYTYSFVLLILFIILTTILFSLLNGFS